MKLHWEKSDQHNTITSYATNEIRINTQTYRKSLIISPQQIITDWEALQDTTLVAVTFTNDFFEKISRTLHPELILIGTGEKQQFLHPSSFTTLTQQGIALECMTTAAACRTYNILVGESRNIAAVLLL